MVKAIGFSKRPFALLLVLCLVGVLPLPAAAWGQEGHRIVARIAQQRLKAKARAEVKKLLGNTTLAAVAVYADDVRGLRPETERWHFVDIQKDQQDYDRARDCPCSRRGDCVVAAIEDFKAILADPQEKPARRAEALKFLVHFVGDLHQPLHATDDHDAGGNAKKVIFYDFKPSSRRPNLHQVWDRGIILHTKLSETAYVSRLGAWLGTQDIEALTGGSVEAWALDAHRSGAAVAYGKLPQPDAKGIFKLDGDDTYFEASRTVVEEQMAKAGVRLAKLLNDILATP